MTTTIAIINQKGGTGKTTTAVNLSAGLARAGYSTLLIDLDPQAHATVGLGLEVNDSNGGREMGDILLAENASLESVITNTYIDRLKVVPSSIRLSKTASLLHSQNFREHRLNQALEGIKGFDYFIIDCQPTLEVLPVNAMVAASHFLIPTQPAGYALRGLGDLIETLQSIKRRGRNWDWRVLLTMVMGQARVTNEMVEQMLEPVRERLLTTVIHRNELLNRAQTDDTPKDIFEYDKHSRGAKDYQALVEEITKLWHSQ